MSSSISFTDSEGPAVLTNGKPGSAGRFTSWAPRTIPMNDRAWALGTGALHTFEFRVDYGAVFELRDIPNTSMPIMERLVRHLARGGTVTVATGDAAGRSYTAGLAPEADLPHPRLSERRLIEYSMAFSVINLGAVPTPMLCIFP